MYARTNTYLRARGAELIVEHMTFEKINGRINQGMWEIHRRSRTTNRAPYDGIKYSDYCDVVINGCVNRLYVISKYAIYVYKLKEGVIDGC